MKKAKKTGAKPAVSKTATKTAAPRAGVKKTAMASKRAKPAPAKKAATASSKKAPAKKAAAAPKKAIAAKAPAAKKAGPAAKAAVPSAGRPSAGRPSEKKAPFARAITPAPSAVEALAPDVMPAAVAAPEVVAAPPAAAAPPASAPPPAILEAADAGDDGVKSSATIEAAERIIANADAVAIAAQAESLLSEKPTTATHAARLLDEILARKPELMVSTIERMVQAIQAPQKRAVQTAAGALPILAKHAPARVARHLATLTERFPACSDVAKDGLVSTFAALCTASVAYQKRLEPVLELALSSADPKTLLRWSEIVLPSLKGEPHARARAVVEERLPAMPRPLAQPIATFLGIKLRPAAMIR